MLEFMADADLWGMIKMLQSFSRIAPVLSILRDDFVRTLNDMSSVRKRLGEPRLWDPIQDAAVKAKDRSEKDDFATVVTGHSLGGGLSQIIASHVDVPALVWSPVGVGYSLDRFNVSKTRIYKRVTAVLPEHDAIVDIDMQLAMTQHILCRSTDPISCHLMSRSLCEMLAMCGDDRGRRGNCTAVVG
jgi:hypothetical protein